MKKEESNELTLYVTKISVSYNTKSFIRIIAAIPKESLWIELPEDGIPKEVTDKASFPLMLKFWEELKPFIQDSVKKQEEITNSPTDTYRIKYNKEFLSIGSLRVEQQEKSWSDLQIPMTEHEIYFFHSIMNMSKSFF